VGGRQHCCTQALAPAARPQARARSDARWRAAGRLGPAGAIQPERRGCAHGPQGRAAAARLCHLDRRQLLRECAPRRVRAVAAGGCRPPASPLACPPRKLGGRLGCGCLPRHSSAECGVSRMSGAEMLVTRTPMRACRRGEMCWDCAWLQVGVSLCFSGLPSSLSRTRSEWPQGCVQAG